MVYFFKEILLCVFLFFFFQAEDGIRDLTVTGVQTCALPILRNWIPFPSSRPRPSLDLIWSACRVLIGARVILVSRLRPGYSIKSRRLSSICWETPGGS